MTRDDIISMARDAFAVRFCPLPVSESHIERFATLVANAERKAILNILWDYAGRKDLSDSDESLLKHLVDLIRARGET